jgi:hypothetical protein
VLGTATVVALGGFLFAMFRREGKQRRMKSSWEQLSGEVDELDCPSPPTR